MSVHSRSTRYADHGHLIRIAATLIRPPTVSHRHMRQLFAPHRLRISLIAFALLVAAGPLRAQLSVTVSDSAGIGLPSARVELWRESLLSVARYTDSLGVAAFSASEAAGATELRARRIGFVPVAVPVRETAGSVAIRLVPMARSLTAANVIARIQACPVEDERAARALWARIASGYREPSLDSRQTELDQRVATVEADAVDQASEGELRAGARMFTSLGMEGAHRQMESRRYVVAAPKEHDYEFFGAWQYAPIEAELAGHFATRAFAAAHDFAVASQRDSATTIVFCAKDRRATGLDGSLQVSEVSGFVAARWRFWNPQTSEIAGGAVTFEPRAPGDAEARLLSTSGLFWRQLPSGKYLQRWQVFQGWRLDESSVSSEDSPSLSARCNPPLNYVLCSVSSVRGPGRSSLSQCFSMAYQCFD